MITIRKIFGSILLASCWFSGASFAAEVIDYEVIAAIKEEGIQPSQAMATLSYLTDIHGPRFAGTPGYYAAAEWARQQMNDWGLDAHLEAYPVDYLGWGILSHSVEMTSPRYMRLSAVPAPWASSTAEVSGELIQLQFDDLEVLQEHQGKLKNKILILPAEIEAGYEDDGYADYDFNAELHKMTQALKPSMSNPDDESDERIFEYLHDWPNQEKENRDKSREIIAWLKKEKVAALLEGTTLPYGVIGAKSSSALIMDSPENSLPHFILSREHHGRLLRTIEKGIPAAVKLSLSTRFYDEPKYHSNVIAEIKGSHRKKRDEVVMVGAHFDSWQTGTGASDNAFGSVVMMEALRILKTLNLKMDRTVRIGLWGGEEQYYDGSADYDRKQFGTVIGSNDFSDAQAKISVYFNLDNGARKIRGVYLQGNEKTRGFFTENLAPFSYLGANHVSAMSGGGTDHIIFNDLNIPAFQLIQGSQGGPPVST
ncbi:MAG: M28 family peptidase, partial [Xanthomonadales bacterium]|nr:M28 family peptidase [Xanthomonadales bacterium]